MKYPTPFREKIDASRQQFWKGLDESDLHHEQELFKLLITFRESHPIDIMAEYDRIRKGSD